MLGMSIFSVKASYALTVSLIAFGPSLVQAMQPFPTFVVSRLGEEYEKAAFDYISGKMSDSGLPDAKAQVGLMLTLQYKLDCLFWF